MITSDNSDTLFSTSINWYIILGFSLFTLFLSVGVVELATGIRDPIAIATPFIIAGAEFYLAFKAYSFRVRKAVFYDDKFEIVRGSTKSNFEYSQISRVTLVRGIWIGNSVAISLLGEEEPLTILRNPKSSSLNSSLYSWLKKRIAKQSI